MLVLSRVEKRFGAVQALRGVSLTVAPGEVVGLLGENGAGKTTTIRLAVGLTRPDAGSIDIAGQGSPERAEVRRLIGYAPQAITTYDELTARENVELAAGLCGLSGRALRNASARALERVGLAQHATERAGTFSVGMQRRLTLATALAHGPRVVVLDEPTAGVDPHARVALFEVVRSLRADGAAVLYTTHLLEEAEALCDRLAIMHRGVVVAQGSVEEMARGLMPAPFVPDESGPRSAPSSGLGALFLSLTGRGVGEP